MSEYWTTGGRVHVSHRELNVHSHAPAPRDARRRRWRPASHSRARTARTSPPRLRPLFRSRAAPCSGPATLQLSVAQTARVDCGNGGTTVTLAGNGASYLVVAEFAVDQVPDAFVPYRLVVGNRTRRVGEQVGSAHRVCRGWARCPPYTRLLWDLRFAPIRPGATQRAFSAALRARARRMVSSGAWRASRAATRELGASHEPTSPPFPQSAACVPSAC